METCWDSSCVLWSEVTMNIVLQLSLYTVLVSRQLIFFRSLKTLVSTTTSCIKPLNCIKKLVMWFTSHKQVMYAVYEYQKWSMLFVQWFNKILYTNRRSFSWEMRASEWSMSRVLCQDLSLGGYHQGTGHFLTLRLLQNSKRVIKKSLKKCGKDGYRRILFMDEKVFIIEEKFYKQNDQVYAWGSMEAKNKCPRFQWGHYPTLVMTWWGSVTRQP